MHRVRAGFRFPHLIEFASGLLGIELSFETDDPAAAGDYVLEVFEPSLDRQVLSRPLHIPPSGLKLNIAVNTHLQENGEAKLVFFLREPGGDTVWTDTATYRVANNGPLAANVRASMQRFGTPLVVDGPCDSSHYDYRDPSLVPWFDRPDAKERCAEMRKTGKISASEEESLLHFVEEGYLVVPERIEDELIDLANREIDQAVADRWAGYTYGSSQRLEQLHQKYPGIRRIWQHPTTFRYLQLIFGVPARPCQTLTYVFGSQQDAHQDLVHLTPYPAGFMCGVWIALEDVQPDSGELEVFPRSHRFPRLYMQDAGCPKVVGGDWSVFHDKVVTRWERMIADNSVPKVTYRPRRGTILIWHENLMHAGSIRKDPTRTRRSVVVHAFAEGAVAYYDSTGLPGIVYSRE